MDNNNFSKPKVLGGCIQRLPSLRDD
jgi:hypothetical protein